MLMFFSYLLGKNIATDIMQRKSIMINKIDFKAKNPA